MGSIFRSEEMQLCQLILHTESAYMCIAQLGELGVVQIRDAIPGVNAFQRKFVDEVRRCDDMERKLRYIESELQKDNFPIFEPDEIPEAPPPKEMRDLESNLDKLENELREVNMSLEELKKAYMKETELKRVLRWAQMFFDEGTYEVNVALGGGGDMLVETPESLESRDLRSSYIEMVSQSDDFDVGFRQGHATSTTYTSHHVDFVAGVILRERTVPFERMLWRACRGNVFLRYADLESIEDPSTGELLDKCMFIVFFQGSQLRSRVEKISEGFHATLYLCPDTQEKWQASLIEVTSRRDDIKIVIDHTLRHRAKVLETASEVLRKWFYMVHKMKSIYHALNLFHVDEATKCMVGECWCAVTDLDAVQMALRRGMALSNSPLQPILNRLHTSERPPTFHRVNKFTAAFQNIVDAYGVARYREVNPALFTVITFPFLFSVMFGDAGHGVILFLTGLFMVLWEKKLIAKKVRGDFWDTFFGGRYIILLMGAFSIYTGLIYNDIFSKSANIFGSSWYPLFDNRTLDNVEALQLNPATHTASSATSTGMFAGFPYPFGLDPVWQVSSNVIMFTNSLKMKMSIIIGVLHMLFGILLGAFNYRFFKKSLSIYCDLIPEVLFMLSIFGYLVFTIFYKWVVFDSSDADTAPSLLISLINMMKFGYKKNDTTQFLYTGQPIVQSILVVLAVLCVPWMLLAKPLILRHRQKVFMSRTAGFVGGRGTTELEVEAGNGVSSQFRNKTSSSPEIPQAAIGEGSPDGDGHDEPTEFVFSEVMVYQAIHTIEFCLGCISNTASYLRLWALSLAHAQLSEVLWEMVLLYGIKVDGYYGGIILFFLFAVWATLTVSILVVMEGLSAFLHALRLHWVEFQNKFYEGSGYLFEPFTFANMDKLPAQ